MLAYIQMKEGHIPFETSAMFGHNTSNGVVSTSLILVLIKFNILLTLTTTKNRFNIGVLTSVVKKTDVNICAVA